MSRILIIQDSPSINAMLKFRLEANGFLVETAETGEEGIEKTKTGEYQLILLDYNLPRLNGAQVCRILKKENITNSVPIIFISAKDEDKLSVITREAGADGYIGLPLEGRQFVERISGFLNSGNRES